MLAFWINYRWENDDFCLLGYDPAGEVAVDTSMSIEYIEEVLRKEGWLPDMGLIAEEPDDENITPLVGVLLDDQDEFRREGPTIDTVMVGDGEIMVMLGRWEKFPYLLLLSEDPSVDVAKVRADNA